MLEKLFKLKQNKTNVRTEVLAGITTFMTMAYILAVNPTTLEAAGMDKSGVFMATALAAAIGTLCMAFFANYPFALAPGMGLNAFFAYTVASQYGWQTALAAVFIEGIIFILLSLTNIREMLFNSIPQSLKYAVSCGIGLFIAFIGLQNAKIVVNHDATLVTIRDFSENFHSAGMAAILALIGVIITAVLLIKKVKGGILIGILATWILGMICQGLKLYVPNIELELYSLIPDFRAPDLGAIANVAGKLDFSGIMTLNFIVVIFTFLFVDMFDTLGTLMGVAAKSDMLDKDGKLPRIKGALIADAIATSAGALLGTSTTTTYVESATGVSEGGKTGLTAFTTAILFIAAILLSPIFLAIPGFATAPALIIVGFYMMGSIMKINFNDMTDAIPAFICIAAMPFTYSIAEGIALGIISYTVITLITGKRKEKKLSPVMIVLTLLFIAKYIFL